MSIIKKFILLLCVLVLATGCDKVRKNDIDNSQSIEVQTELTPDLSLAEPVMISEELSYEDIDESYCLNGDKLVISDGEGGIYYQASVETDGFFNAVICHEDGEGSTEVVGEGLASNGFQPCLYKDGALWVKHSMGYPGCFRGDEFKTLESFKISSDTIFDVYFTEDHIYYAKSLAAGERGCSAFYRMDYDMNEPELIFTADAKIITNIAVCDEHIYWTALNFDERNNEQTYSIGGYDMEKNMVINLPVSGIIKAAGSKYLYYYDMTGNSICRMDINTYVKDVIKSDVSQYCYFRRDSLLYRKTIVSIESPPGSEELNEGGKLYVIGNGEDKLFFDAADMLEGKSYLNRVQPEDGKVYVSVSQSGDYYYCFAELDENGSLIRIVYEDSVNRE